MTTSSIRSGVEALTHRLVVQESQLIASEGFAAAMRRAFGLFPGRGRELPQQRLMNPSQANTSSDKRTHIVGVSLEDYYQVGAFSHLVEKSQWGRFESRLAHSTRAALDLLDRHQATATFFTLGWVAEHMPELVREVMTRGHEIANAGFSHRGTAELDRAGLADELARGHEAIVRATHVAPRGTRIPDFVRPQSAWALDVVAEAGYAYDASYRPMGRDAIPPTASRFPFQHRTTGRDPLHVLPVPTARVGPWLLPIGGGAWLRQLPWALAQRAITRWETDHEHPFGLYFQVWELDPEQPRITAASRVAHLRQYRNLAEGERRLNAVMQGRRFTSFANYLQLPPVAATVPVQPWTRPVLVPRATPTGTPVSVIIPCFNEADTLPFLLNTLASVQRSLSGQFLLSFVFVDDGSSDATWETLTTLTAARSDCTLVRQPQNRGIASAILAGMAAARDEYVCSIDADCTYDPHQIALLLPSLLAGATLVTASPYHPSGRVKHVPEWRLVLSRTLSRMYRLSLHSPLHTFTSCFRAYRRSAFVDMPLRNGGFLGIAEMLARAVKSGARVEEVPATLEVRLMGHSKLKVLRVIGGHLGLLAGMHRWDVPATTGDLISSSPSPT